MRRLIRPDPSRSCRWATYARMLGHDPEEVVGKKIVEVIGEKAFDTILPHIKAVLLGTAYQDGLFSEHGSNAPLEPAMPIAAARCSLTRIACSVLPNGERVNLNRAP